MSWASLGSLWGLSWVKDNLQRWDSKRVLRKTTYLKNARTIQEPAQEKFRKPESIQDNPKNIRANLSRPSEFPSNFQNMLGRQSQEKSENTKLTLQSVKSPTFMCRTSIYTNNEVIYVSYYRPAPIQLPFDQGHSFVRKAHGHTSFRCPACTCCTAVNT